MCVCVFFNIEHCILVLIASFSSSSTASFFIIAALHTHKHTHTPTHTLPAGAQHVTTHPVVLPGELEDGDLEALGELGLGMISARQISSGVRLKKEAAEEKGGNTWQRSHHR